MENFAAIDFETANREASSVCSVGVVIVRGGEISERIYRLIHPEPDYYLYWNTRVHGLRAEDTASAPLFPDVWKEIAPRIEGFPLVAHNSPFDERCLKAAFKTYGMDYPDYKFYCTCRASRRTRLQVLLHLPGLAPHVWQNASEPPTPDRSRPLRIRPHATPPRPGRRRSLCLDCVADYPGTAHPALPIYGGRIAGTGEAIPERCRNGIRTRCG